MRIRVIRTDAMSDEETCMQDMGARQMSAERGNAVGRGFQGAVLDLLGARQFDLKVVQTQDVYGGVMRRVSFSSDSPLPASLHEAAAWLRLWFPLEGGREVQRGYTISSIAPDSDGCDIDFFVHDGGGPAAHWATHAKVGDHLHAQVMGSRPFQQDEALQGVVLFADESAFPAVCSILRVLPINVHAEVIVGGDHDLTAFLPERRNKLITARFVDGASPVSCVESVLQSVMRDGPGLENWQFWAAGERSALRDIRVLIARGRHFPRSAVHIQAYWIAGRSFTLER